MYSLVLAVFSHIAEAQDAAAEYLCFSFSLSLKVKHTFFVCPYQKKRKEKKEILEKKYLINFSQVRFLTFSKYSGHSWATYSLF